jgi:hypothetical protein
MIDNEPSQYRCETCAHSSPANSDNTHAMAICTLCCEAIYLPEWKHIIIVGCASHSDFKKPIDVLKEAISIWWKCYNPVPRSRYAKKSYQKNGERIELKIYHHHHIKRSIFMKYWEMTDMATNEEGLTHLNTFIKKFKPNDVDSNYLLKKEFVDNMNRRDTYGKSSKNPAEEKRTG